MTKGRIDRDTKARHPIVKIQGGRNRTAQFPDYRMPNIVPLSLFTGEDIQRLSAEAVKLNPTLQLRRPSDVELIKTAQLLRQAFAWAIQCVKMQEWEAEPQRKRRWYQQVVRRSDDLLKALDLIPEDCRDPTKERPPWSMPTGLQEFRQSLDRMVSARPDLPDQLDALSRVTWDEGGPKLDENCLNEDGHCKYRGRASFLVDRLPRTIALVSMLAKWQLEQFERHPRSHAKQSDLFGRELFKFLAGGHEMIYHSKPLTRIKSGEAIGGSIDWARAVIRHAADAIEASPQPLPSCADEDAETSAIRESQFLAQARAIAAPYVARLRGLAKLSKRRVGDLLEEGWRHWKAQIHSSAR